MTQQDVQLYRLFQKSPILFIEKMWGLVPQPFKPEYVNEARYLNPEDYKAEMFGEFRKGKNFTWQQYALLLSIEKAMSGRGLKRISVESGHGTGKSAVLAMLILWFLFCFKNAQIPCTAPTSDQMHDILWKEVKLWLDRMPEYAKDRYEWTTGYVRIKDSPETWFARAKTARKENPEALAGVHGDYVMFIIDEASGVPEEIFNVAEGALTGENILVIMISNHTRLIGYFHESHNSDSHNWQRLSFDSEESPIVDKKFVDRIREKHGEDSDEWRVRVKGKSPKEDAVDDKGFTALFNESDIRMAPDSKFTSRKRMGVDPSGEGNDETVWVVRDKFKAKVVGREKISTPKSIAQKTMTLMELYDVKSQDVFVDNFGVGANVAQELGLAQKRVKALNVGERPDNREDAERYLNVRAKAFWGAKEWLRKGGEFVSDDGWKELFTIRYRAELSGKLKIMGKDEMRKIGFQSPNVADAFSLTFIEPDTWDSQGYRVQEETQQFDRFSPV